MNINELILEFIDGTSTPEMDKSLFEQLANNETAQQKMKKIIEVENSFASNSSYFQPSAESVNQVFSKLGMKKTGLFDSFSLMQSNFMRFAIPSALVTLSLVFLYNYFFIANSIEANLEYEVVSLKLNDIPEENIVISNTRNDMIDASNSLQANNQANFKSNNLKSIGLKNIDLKSENIQNNSQNNIVKYIYKDKFVTLDEEGNLLNFETKEDLISYLSKNKNNLIEITKSDFNEIDLVKNFNQITPKNLGENNSAIDEKKLKIGRDYKSKSNFEFTILLSPTFDFKNNPIQPDQISKFNNLSANLIYRLNSKLGLGAEIQQETFLQSFTESDNFDRTIIYTQRPNFTNVGIAVNYSLLDKIQLYGAIGTNTNFSGFYNRFRIGREINSVFPTDFIIGLEYSTLHFMFNENYFNSNKFGLFFGAKL
jgi:hypothetical protein